MLRTMDARTAKKSIEPPAEGHLLVESNAKRDRLLASIVLQTIIGVAILRRHCGERLIAHVRCAIADARLDVERLGQLAVEVVGLPAVVPRSRERAADRDERGSHGGRQAGQDERNAGPRHERRKRGEGRIIPIRHRMHPFLSSRGALRRGTPFWSTPAHLSDGWAHQGIPRCARDDRFRRTPGRFLRLNSPR